MKKFIIAILLVTFLFFNISFAIEDVTNGNDIFDLNLYYSAKEIYQAAKLLEGKYPEIIEVLDLGESLDGRQIFAVVMSENVVKTIRSKDSYVGKMHFLVETGTHGRENVGPNVIMKTIETYAKDYYDDSILLECNLKDMLKDNVIHFIPLVNPDGYDLTTQGISSISYDYRVQLRSYRDWKFSKYKANLNGVDINRNYPGYYYDIELGKWRDIWNMIHNDNKSYIPSGAFYFGPYGGSEIETQIMMDYILKYDFRNYLSYHNRGEVIYWDKWMLSKKHNERSGELSSMAAALTGYQPEDSDRSTSSSGYMTDYASMNTLKPAITLELNDWRTELPAGNEYFPESYEKTKLVPLAFVKIGQKTGYFDYKWYKDGIYVRDFEEKIYADVFALEYGGTIIQEKGKPRLYLDRGKNNVTRIEVIKKVMSMVDYDLKEVLYEFEDCYDIDVLRARRLGIISGYNNYFRPNDYVSYEELYVILHRSFFPTFELENVIDVNISKRWAIESFLVLVENDVLDYIDIRVGNISLDGVNKMLNDITLLMMED